MKDIYRHSQASLLAFIAEVAGQFTTEYGVTFTPVNLDAVGAPEELPAGHILGVSEFSLTGHGDAHAVDSCSAIVHVGVENDPNNMLVSQVVSRLFDRLQPQRLIPMVNAGTGAPIGNFQIVGPTLALPVDRTSTNKVLVGITLQAGLALV